MYGKLATSSQRTNALKQLKKEPSFKSKIKKETSRLAKAKNLK